MLVLLLLLVVTVLIAFISPSTDTNGTHGSSTYGSRLEAYIVSKDPKDAADVERLTREFDRRIADGSM